MNYTNRVLFIVLTLIAFSFSGCKSLKENARFAKCEFKTRRISKLAIGGVQILNKRSINDFTTQEGLSLVYQAKQQKLITNLTVDVQVKNPNNELATLRGFQYVLVIGGKEIINTEIKSVLDIPANGERVFGVNSRFDLIKAAKDTGYDTLLKLAIGLTEGRGQPVKFDLYFRPSIYIKDKKVKYKDFIKLSSVYQGGTFKNKG